MSSRSRLVGALAAVLFAAAPVHAQLAGSLDPNDAFGSTLATGDFDGDGFGDLVVGVPYQDVRGVIRTGSVHVIYGGASGLSASRNRIWTVADLGVSPDLFDLFGFALATGDFDADGFDDLAAGAPYRTVGPYLSAGAVGVLYGSEAGLTADRAQHWTQDDFGAPNEARPDESFGYALAAGDFDGDGRDDLAVGTPFEPLANVERAGLVDVLYGTADGLSADGHRALTQASAGGLGADANFGEALCSGDFNGDGYDDLAAGSPGHRVNPYSSGHRAGAVTVFDGSENGLAISAAQSMTRGSDFQANARYGSSLASGDLDGDGFADLVAGVPLWDNGANAVDAGLAEVLYGTTSGISTQGPVTFREIGNRTLMGAAFAFGDFDADGRVDVSVGSPGGWYSTDPSHIPGVGRVFHFPGRSDGQIGWSNSLWFQQPDLGEVPETGDRFGDALAAGDFNGDGFEDLAIGVPNEDLDGVSNAGAVHVMYGGNGGPSVDNTLFLYQGAGLPVADEAGPEAALDVSAAPNPFRDGTAVRFALAAAGRVRLVAYDVLGREVARLVDGPLGAGPHEVRFEGRGLPAGPYLLRLDAGGLSQAWTVTLVR
ncbi:FG-GAP repeat protein [Rubrivirga sp.]|uniref:FG-GAP repeat protein n=1 Tax=Rubrivirga sp. TaxID=1885344 RepID=UPI003B519B86